MKYLPIKLTPLALVILVWISFSNCDKPSSETVDHDYLNTEEYSRFSKQADQEQKRAAKQKRSLAAKLDQMDRCPAALRKTLPLQIPRSSIVEKQKTQSRTTGKADYNLKLIACTSDKDLGIRWIVREWPSIYVQSELLMATYKNDDLVKYEVVGLFRDNLSEDIATDIDAKKDKNGLMVSATTDRNIRYPIEQHNTVQTIYHIGREGNIIVEK